MIKLLRIRNLATIEDLELRLEKGFTILTGETGAGKSIIIDALLLILGEKGSPDLIRTGCREARIEAVLDSPGEGFPADLKPEEGDDLYLQRHLADQGAGKAYINGVLTPVRRLKEISPLVIDVYGQNDHVFLLHLDNHLRYLDAFCEAEALKGELLVTARNLRDLIRQKQELESHQRERAHRLDLLDFQIREIENARLQSDEEDVLRRERDILKNAERVSALVDRALDISYQREESILPLLAKLRTALAELAPFAPDIAAVGGDLETTSISLRELADALLRFKERQAEAPDSLESLEERLNAIEKLKRKYGATLADVFAYLEAVKKERAALSTSEERLGGLEALIESSFKDYSGLSSKLSARRKKGAAELEKQVAQEIGLLGMKKARFAIRLAQGTPTLSDPSTIQDNGLDAVEFLISPNPGEELRPLKKIASGGELSRVMLALKAVGKERESLKTLIFDEIDSGIGGKTAEFVAHKLSSLALRHQVICITHLPQIASFAAHHFRIEKTVSNKRTFTTVMKLTSEERAEEIARLIAGTRISAASLQIAREMLRHNLGEAPD